MSSNSRKQLEDWLKTIDVKADCVLDIGGSQLPIISRPRSWEVRDYVILDLDNPHKISQDSLYYKKTNRDIAAKNATDGLTEYFDTVFCLEVMEYVIDPVAVLKNIRDFLVPGGVLYISFHFIYPIHKPSGLDYLRYTEHGVRKLLAETGFEIEDFKYRDMETGASMIETVMSLECMRPDKDYQHHYAQGYLVKARKK